MDAQALDTFHSQLRLLGYIGSAEQLRALLNEAQARTDERLVLSWWQTQGCVKQHAALLAAFGHAHKRGMSVAVFSHADRARLVMSRERGFEGVTLGAVDVDGQEVRWSFYRDNEIVGQRHSPV